MKKVVLFVFYDSKTKKVLSELRSKNDPDYPSLKTFPAGKVEKNEKNIQAFFREIKEELNIIPITYKALTTIKGKNDIILYPYIITHWEGALPYKILDKEYELTWETFDEVYHSLVPTRPKIIKLVESYLNKIDIL